MRHLGWLLAKFRLNLWSLPSNPKNAAGAMTSGISISQVSPLTLPSPAEAGGEGNGVDTFRLPEAGREGIRVVDSLALREVGG